MIHPTLNCRPPLGSQKCDTVVYFIVCRIRLAVLPLTLNWSTVSHFWLPNGGLQLTSGEQKLVSESRSRSVLSVRTVD